MSTFHSIKKCQQPKHLISQRSQIGNSAYSIEYAGWGVSIQFKTKTKPITYQLDYSAGNLKSW